MVHVVPAGACLATYTRLNYYNANMIYRCWPLLYVYGMGGRSPANEDSGRSYLEDTVESEMVEGWMRFPSWWTWDIRRKTVWIWCFWMLGTHITLCNFYKCETCRYGELWRVRKGRRTSSWLVYVIIFNLFAFVGKEKLNIGYIPVCL